jgi:hypothetical protein
MQTHIKHLLVPMAFAVLGLAVAHPAHAQQLQDGGFESSVFSNGTFGYDPTGSAWTFLGSSGISANGSGFTGGNPNAPEGRQVAVLQSVGSFSQTVTGFAAGQYSLTFDAAQRINSAGYSARNQNFQVLVDGVSVGAFDPALDSGSYQPFTTGTFTAAAGSSHTVQFVGLDTVGGDNTAFIDAVQLNSTAVPEPSSVAVFAFVGIGAMGLLLKARRRSAKA